MHGVRIGWFNSKVDPWFNQAGGILSGYRRCTGDQLRRKFKVAEQMARRLYGSRGHQNDTTGERSEADVPLFRTPFFHYFDYLNTRNTQMMNAQRSRDRHRRVNRSLIGQQPSLTSTTTTNELNSSVAPAGRERGSGEVRTDVSFDVEEEKVQEGTNNIVLSSSTSTSTSTSSSRPPAPMRSSPGNRNVSFGVSNNSFLPPSATDRNAINVDRIESNYNAIALSIHSLATQNRMRRIDEINDDIIKTIREKNEIVNSGGESSLVAAYEKKLVTWKQSVTG